MVSTKISTTLNVNAPPFIPSVGWKTPLTDDMIWQTGMPYHDKVDGFVILDHVIDFREVPDEELFDPTFYPFTQTDLRELEACDQMNELLAELEILDMQEELHRKMQEKCIELEEYRHSEEPMIQNILKRNTKKEQSKYEAKKANQNINFKLQHHAKSPRFSRQLHQPRSSY
ncbi:hypothetical protein THRCLA_02074 [Thraustotheca clavata]|uniref:Uncharacterized protein n=1 Tax=Thraustotheca clavata TaxID=74557 RepID=A0A1W0A6F4_9STRA|nr:hypothetical protein THRCLA_02074 [Thraustotheca clavata]